MGSQLCLLGLNRGLVLQQVQQAPAPCNLLHVCTCKSSLVMCERHVNSLKKQVAQYESVTTD